MLLNVPNSLTLFRIVAIPLVVICFYLPMDWGRPAAGVLFGLAAITDWFDGYFARRLGQTSPFGAFLDPVADKLTVTTTLVILVQAHPGWVTTMIAAIIIGREITVSALREWMSEIGARARVAVSFFGKWKTTMQMFGIAFMLYEERLFGLPTYEIGVGLLILAAGITLWSMFDYMRAAWPLLMASAQPGQTSGEGLAAEEPKRDPT